MHCYFLLNVKRGASQLYLGGASNYLAPALAGRTAAVHFDTYKISQRHHAVSLSQHGFFVGLCLQIAVNYLSKRDRL